MKISAGMCMNMNHHAIATASDKGRNGSKRKTRRSGRRKRTKRRRSRRRRRNIRRKLEEQE